MDGFPLSKQLSCAIKGKDFEFIVQSFNDQMFVVATEKGRIGQIVRASCDTNITSSKVHYKNETIMGLDTDFATLIARRLVEDINQSIGTKKKHLLLGVAFDKKTADDFDMIPLIVQCINQIKLW